MEGLIALAVLATGALFTWVVIWADKKDAAAYDAWYEDPAQIWNS